MLSRLLQAKQPLFDITIKQLEDKTHNQSIDTKLMAEILGKAHQKIRELGLDAADTTGQELYSALMNRVRDDNIRLAKMIGGQDINNIQHMIPLIIKRTEKIKMPRDAWVIKKDTAAQMLLQMPPKKILKKLRYDSVKEMLAEENLFEIYAALRFAESGDWLNKFIHQYRSLTEADFEWRQIQVINFDVDKWGNIAEHFIEKKLHNITHLKELGVIIFMPVAPNSKMTGQGITLKAFALLLHYFNEIRLYSAFFRLVMDKKNFGEVFVNTLVADPSHVKVLQGNYVHWRVIQRYFGKLSHEEHPEVFEPHVQPEDLHWRKAEEILYEVDPKLAFWEDLDYVGVHLKDGEPMTFNLMDVAFSYANGVAFGDRYLYHFREALWNEIFISYFGEKNLRDRILKRLDNSLIAPETIKV